MNKTIREKLIRKLDDIAFYTIVAISLIVIIALLLPAVYPNLITIIKEELNR